MSSLFDGPGVHPLRDLFDAAVRHKTVRLTCVRCRHANSFSAAALWWLFQRNGWKDRFDDVRRRCVCRRCRRADGARIANPALELVDEVPGDASLPMPSDLDWKRELRRRR